MIRFEGTDEEFQLVVEASSSPVPVFPAEACIDLRCCVFGKLYIKKVTIIYYYCNVLRFVNAAPLVGFVDM